MSNTATWL